MAFEQCFPTKNVLFDDSFRSISSNCFQLLNYFFLSNFCSLFVVARAIGTGDTEQRRHRFKQKVEYILRFIQIKQICCCVNETVLLWSLIIDHDTNETEMCVFFYRNVQLETPTSWSIFLSFFIFFFQTYFPCLAYQLTMDPLWFQKWNDKAKETVPQNPINLQRKLFYRYVQEWLMNYHPKSINFIFESEGKPIVLIEMKFNANGRQKIAIRCDSVWLVPKLTLRRSLRAILSWF